MLGDGGGTPTPNEPATWRAQNVAMQAAAARTSTGVPLLVGNDSVHGQNNLANSTLYPHHIGLGCMRNADGAADEQMMERLAAMAAAESYACGINWMFSPCIAVPQDVRPLQGHLQRGECVLRARSHAAEAGGGVHA